ncbi:MAG: hypothetical protein GXO31_07475 [Epsilonproteobacteria bacterium]|nr:hypothetical protein [Campylobacterota bacterium]
MKEGFNEYGEPTLREMDDYKGTHSEEKKNVIKWVIISGLILGAVFALARWYFWDAGEPDLNRDQVIIKHY